MEMRYSRDRRYPAEKLKLTNHCLEMIIFPKHILGPKFVDSIIAKAIKVHC